VVFMLGIVVVGRNGRLSWRVRRAPFYALCTMVKRQPPRFHIQLVIMFIEFFPQKVLVEMVTKISPDLLRNSVSIEKSHKYCPNLNLNSVHI
jgi:hypothetical protein